MKENNNQKGITLIALIITIIVMLILVGVTVAVALNGGLFSTAKTASVDTRAEMVREKAEEWKAIKEADEYTNDKKAQTLEELVNELESQKLITADEKNTILSEGQVTIGTKTIIFEKDEDLDMIERYFLGENKSGSVRIDEIFGNLSFINNNVIQDADKSIKLYDGNLGNDNMQYYMEITYKQKAYKVLINNESFMIDNLERIYSLKGREGQKVLYSYDGNQENLKEWTILHDYGDTIEIISPDVFGPFTIGRKDTAIDWTNSNVISEANIDGTDGISDSEKMIYSYNHAIENLNKYCEEQITNTNKVSVRSVGSNTSNPSSENATLYIYDKLPEGYPNGVAKSADENYLEDYRAMNCLNMASIGKSYWLASRSIRGYSFKEFYILGIDENGEIFLSDGLWTLNSSQGIHDLRDRTFAGVRPVVKVKTDSVNIID